MQETYFGKIKMIYIDPPYNTGNDFVYEDDFAQSADEYLENSGQFDDEGNRLVKNLDSNGRFHTDWLNMIYPRLKLAKDLLAEDGVIFISIDDAEVSNLRKICDDAFGADNFVANLIWQKKFSRSNDAKYFSTMHDHILCYCKANLYSNENGWKIGLLPRDDEIPAGYSNPDNDPRGPWTSVVLSAKSGSDSLLYEITTPSGRKIVPPSGRFWSCSQETFNKWNNDNRIWFGVNGDGSPRKKTFLSEVQSGLRPNTLLLQTDVGHNQEGKQEVKKLFDDVGVFDSPKPVRLLKTLVVIANLKDDDIVMDFFSGSSTTAHAVMQLNAEDGGNRKFIMVQLPEETDEKSEAYKTGYKNICEIGKKRIRRAGKKIKEENPLTTQNLDTGFRVLKCDSSNMKDVYYNPSEYEPSLFESLTDNIKEDRTPEDLLFQIMLDLGVLLSSKIEERVIDGKKVFNVAEGFLIACFDKNVTDEYEYVYIPREMSKKEVEGRFEVEKQCPMCGTVTSIYLTDEDMDKYSWYSNSRFNRRGSGLPAPHIQNLFPDRTEEERELMMSGYCYWCQELIFGEDEFLLMTEAEFSMEPDHLIAYNRADHDGYQWWNKWFPQKGYGWKPVHGAGNE